jgi:hypothetical protein
MDSCKFEVDKPISLREKREKFFCFTGENVCEFFFLRQVKQKEGAAAGDV